jgi:release factor glutamine methyltransferase
MLLTRSQAELPAASLGAYWALVEARAQRRPLQHLTGSQAFWRHAFQVTPEVLIPRPETEQLVEAALALLRDLPGAIAVDVGTGSGCIALSLAAELPQAEIHATEISPAALAVAADNARSLGLAGRVRFHQGDLLAPVAGLAGRVDLVASNPPYVALEEREALAPEVRDHEPPVALFAPGERFSVYRRLVPAAAQLLRPGGHLLLELGAGMDAEVTAQCRAAGLEPEWVKADLMGIPRTLLAQRR